MLLNQRQSLGPTAVFRLHREPELHDDDQRSAFDLIVCSNNLQCLDLEAFRSQGIEPTRRKVLVVKSMQHFRAAFEPISSRVELVDGGGLSSPSRFTSASSSHQYLHIPRPTYPFDESALDDLRPTPPAPGHSSPSS
jgi:microcystin degradation protein MlrC